MKENKVKVEEKKVVKKKKVAMVDFASIAGK